MQWPLFSLVTFWTAFGQIVSCPTGYHNFTVDSMTPVCLRFAKDVRGTWETWRFRCQSERADLAKLEGNLHTQVVSYINQHSDLKDDGFWIGGTDAGHEGTWIWAVDGTSMPMGAPHWYPCTEQPDGGTRENYACMYTPDFFFHSCRNAEEIYAICQI